MLTGRVSSSSGCWSGTPTISSTPRIRKMFQLDDVPHKPLGGPPFRGSLNSPQSITSSARSVSTKLKNASFESSSHPLLQLAPTAGVKTATCLLFSSSSLPQESSQTCLRASQRLCVMTRQHRLHLQSISRPISVRYRLAWVSRTQTHKTHQSNRSPASPAVLCLQAQAATTEHV